MWRRLAEVGLDHLNGGDRREAGKFGGSFPESEAGVVLPPPLGVVVKQGIAALSAPEGGTHSLPPCPFTEV